MKTLLTELLGIELPIIQAPMAGASTPEMAAAVSRAGGLGSVPLGALDAAGARLALRAAREQTHAPIAANVFVHRAPSRNQKREADFLAEIQADFEAAGAQAPDALSEIYSSFNDDDVMLEMLLAERPPVVSLHFGAATPARMSALKKAGIIILATATSLEEAQLLESSGVDVLVMQGFDAGGHSGAFLSEPDASTGGRAGLCGLVRSVVDRVGIPVVAAGGLMTGEDVRAMLDAGASGAQLGTAFLCCPESLASDEYRRQLSGQPTTRMTASISGRPARGLANDLMLRMTSIATPPPDYPLTYDGVKQLISATASPGFSVMWAGVGAGRARQLSAGNLVAEIAEEMR